MKNLTSQSFIDKRFQVLSQNTIFESFNLVLEDINIAPDEFDKLPCIRYRSISASVCNDKGKGEYYLFIREGETAQRHEDNVITLTRNLQYEEELDDFIRLLKL